MTHRTQSIAYYYFVVALLLFGKMNELQILGVGVADNLMATIVHRLNRFGITMDAKRIGIE